MNIEEAIKILEAHNKWRRDSSVPAKTKQQNAIKIGVAIDTVLNYLKENKC